MLRIGKKLAFVALLLVHVGVPLCVADDEKLTPQQREWRQALGRGEIPPDLSEELRMVDPNSAEGKRFQSLMQEYAKVLYPDHDFSKEPVRFVLVDEADPNAFYLKHTNPSIIGFTRGLLQTVDNLDQLLSVQGHEMLHRQMAKTYGEGANSKAEEMYANLEPLRRMQDGGFVPAEAAKLDEKLHAKEDRTGKWDRWKWLLSDHVSGPVSQRGFQAALTQLIFERGKLNQKSTPIPAKLSSLVTKARYVSYMDKELAQKGYFDLGRAEKMRVLAEMIKETSHWNAAREKDLTTEIHKLFGVDSIEMQDAMRAILAASEEKWDKPSQKVEDALAKMDQKTVAPKGGTALSRAEWKNLNALADAITVHARDVDSADEKMAQERTRAFYDALFGFKQPNKDAWRGEERFDYRPPLGILRSVRDDYALWMQERDPQKSLQYANSAMSRLDGVHHAGHWYLSSIEWPQFNFPSEEALKGRRFQRWQLPWEELVPIAINDATEQQRRMCYTFGIHDNRIFNELDSLLVARLSYGEIGSLIDSHSARVRGFNGSSGSPVSYQEARGTWGMLRHYLPLNAQGLNELWKRSAKGDAEAHEWLKKIAKSGTHSLQNDISGVDYMEFDLALFLKLNKPVLSRFGVNDLIGNNNQSQGNLVQHFSKLLQKNPDKYRDVIRKYFLEDLKGSADGDYFSQVSGLNFEEPRTQFVIQNKFGLFSEQEVMQFLEDNLGLQGRKASGNYRREILGFLGIQQPKSIEALAKIPSRLANSKYEFMQLLPWLVLDDVFTNRAERGQSGSSATTKHQIDFRGLDVAHYLAEVRNGQTPHRKPHQALMEFGSTRSPISSELHGALILELNGEWPRELDKKVERWQVMNAYDLFQKFGDSWRALPDPEGKHEKLAEILKEIEKVRSPAKRLQYYEQLIFSDQRIMDPDLRKRLFDNWQRNLLLVHGRDDGSDRFTAKVMDIARRVNTQATAADQFDLISRLAKGVQAQERTSGKLKNEALAVDRERMVKTQLGGQFIEVLSNHLEDDPRMGLDAVHFLTEPLTEDSTNRMYKAMKKSINALEKREVRGYGNLSVPDEVRGRQELVSNHRNFWSLPFHARVFIMNQMLLPPALEEDKAWAEAREFVVDRIIPGDSKNAKEYRQAMDDYLKQVESFERGFYLTSLLASEPPNAKRSGDSAFHALAAILKNRGPAEAKVAQGLHSRSDTDPQLRAALSDAKTDIQPLQRWDEWDLIKSLPPEIRSQIASVNGEEGNASFWVVLNVTLKPDSEMAKANGGKTEVALGLLRPYADDRSDSGFARLLGWLEHRKGESYYQHVKEVVEHARDRAVNETDPEVERHQFAEAQRRWGGLVANVDGEDIAIEPVRLLANGKGFKVMSLAEGTHFNDMPTGSKAQKAAKRRNAMVLAYLVISDTLAGLNPDEDSHGGQARVRPGVIHRYDFGGVSMERTTAAERQALIETIMAAVMGNLSGDEGDVKAQLEKMLRQAREAHPAHKSFFLRLESAIFALQDIVQDLRPEDFLKLVVSAIRNDQVHEDYANGVRERFGPAAMEILGNLCGDGFIRLRRGQLKAAEAAAE